MASEPQEGKTIGIVAYITLIGLLIALLMNSDKKSELGKYHIKQSIALHVTGFAFGIIYSIPFIGWFLAILTGWLVSIGLIVLAVLGIVKAANGEMKPVPLIGKYAEQYLTF